MASDGHSQPAAQGFPSSGRKNAVFHGFFAEKSLSYTHLSLLGTVFPKLSAALYGIKTNDEDSALEQAR
jgi:hypothetical protein